MSQRVNPHSSAGLVPEDYQKGIHLIESYNKPKGQNGWLLRSIWPKRKLSDWSHKRGSEKGGLLTPGECHFHGEDGEGVQNCTSLTTKVIIFKTGLFDENIWE